MIRHIVNHNQLLLLRGDDASDVFLKLVVVFRLDEALPTFDGEHNVDIDLRVGIGHAPKMPLLTELENLFCPGSTKMSHLRCCKRQCVKRFENVPLPHSSFDICPSTDILRP